MEHLAIVGAGPAAGTLVRTLRQQGHDGPIDLVGEEPCPPYERPPLSKAVLRGEAEPGDARLPVADGDTTAWHLATRVAALDTERGRLRLDDGCELAWDRLVLATGARPNRLPVPGEGLAGVHYLRSAADAERIRAALRPAASVAVVGAGFIGLEVAASARSAGCEVTVLEADETILSRVLPGAPGGEVAAVHRDRGVRLETGARVSALEGSEAVERVRLADGTAVAADVVVVGIGVTPATELAEQAGIAVDDGILTDARGRTSAPGVHAIGDCARSYLPRYDARVRLESHRNALLQAESVAHELLGAGADHDPVPWLWSDQFDWTLRVAGFPRAATRQVRRGAVADGAVLHLGYDGERLVGAAAFGNSAAAARDLRLAQRMIESGRHPAPEQAGDESLSMKQVWKGAA